MLGKNSVAVICFNLGCGFMAEIWNEESNTLVSGTSGDDYIYNADENVTIDSGDGNDSIVNWGDDSTILGGNGNDYVENDGHTLVKIDTAPPLLLLLYY